MQGTARSNRTQGVCTSKNFVINSLVAENNAADLEKILKKLNQKKLDDDSPHLVSFANCEQYTNLPKDEKRLFLQIFEKNLKQRIEKAEYGNTKAAV